MSAALMPAALIMDPPNDTTPESPDVFAGGERERLARAADRERREAVLRLASGDHKIGPSSSCPLCGGPTVVGRTVQTVHDQACPRRQAMARGRTAAAEGAPLRRPAVTAVPARRQAKTPAVRETAWPSEDAGRSPRPRIRLHVVQSWQVTGARVAVGGWPATVTSKIRTINGVPSVRLDFDDYDTWTREDQDQVPDWWDLEDLADTTWPQHALAA
jgi:hypothetical protein